MPINKATAKKGLRNSGTTAVGAFHETESQELACTSQELTLRGLSAAHKAIEYHGLNNHDKADKKAYTPNECAATPPPSIYHGLRRTSVSDKKANADRSTPSFKNSAGYATASPPPVYHGLQRSSVSEKKAASCTPPMSIIEENLEKPPTVYHGLRRSSVNEKKATAEMCTPSSNEEVTSHRALDPPTTDEPEGSEEPDVDQEPHIEELQVSSEVMLQMDSWGQEQAPPLDQDRTPVPVPHMDSPQTMTDNANTDVEANMPVPSAVNDESLVEARPVLEEDEIHREDLMEAAPFDVAADEQQKAEKHRTQQLQQMTAGLGMVLLLVLIVLGVVIGVVLYGSTEPETIILPPTPEQNETVLSNTTVPSTTVAPTSPLQDFQASLPKFTLDSLNDTSSPQHLAYNWLLEHPQVSNMTESRKLQLYVMGTLYHSLGGRYWGDNLNKDWMNYDKHECDWYTSFFGFKDDLTFCSSPLLGDDACDAYNYDIKICNDQFEMLSIVLASIQPDTLMNDVQIEIPPELGLLSSLRVLWLIDMNVTGTLPTELGMMDSLESLQLSRNALTGQIPTELQTTKVNWLELSDNELSGSIPSELALCPHLDKLTLRNNAITGPLPSGLLPILSWFVANENSISGSIPTELGKNLTQLVLVGNQMTGSIPSEIGLSTQLELLFIFDNELTGTIPTEITLLSNLEKLDITYNKLRGTLPDSLSSMTSLNTLRTSENFFSGSIPSSIGLLENLVEVYLSEGYFTGEIPSELCLLTNIKYLWLNNNLLTGTLPTEVGLLENCVTLALKGNSITGSLPTELGRLSNTNYMFLENTRISGQIPTEIGRLTAMDFISCFDTQLSGTLPSTLGQLVNASGISLYGNSIAGQIPSELGLLPRLDHLDLELNQLTGTIPSELGSIDSLYQLYLSGNLFTGSVPSDLKRMESLGQLLLSSNSLSGPLPNLAAYDGKLEAVFLSDNFFSGSLDNFFTPIDDDGLADLWILKLDNLPLLTGTIPLQLQDLATNHSLGKLDVTGSAGLSGTVPAAFCDLNDDSCFHPDYDDIACYLKFDCTASLCGCDCACIVTNSTKWDLASSTP